LGITAVFLYSGKNPMEFRCTGNDCPKTENERINKTTREENIFLIIVDLGKKNAFQALKICKIF
jgi:hypothetical protein